MQHATFLEIACKEAERGRIAGERPAGAVLTKGGQLISQSHDRCRELDDPIATPEMDCIRRAGRRSDQQHLTLYCTRYPDMLAAGTILQFAIGRVVIGLPEAGGKPIALLREKSVPIEFVPHGGCEAIANAEGTAGILP